MVFISAHITSLSVDQPEVKSRADIDRDRANMKTAVFFIIRSNIDAVYTDSTIQHVIPASTHQDLYNISRYTCGRRPLRHPAGPTG